MIGKVIMDVSNAEIAAAIEYYFNSDLFFTKHHCKVMGVRQRENGRFVVEFDGKPEPQLVATTKPRATAEGTNDG